MDNPGTQSIGWVRDDELSFRANVVVLAKFYHARHRSASVTAHAPDGRPSLSMRCDVFRVISKPTEQAERVQESSVLDFRRRRKPFSFQCVCDSLEIDPGGLR